MSEPADIARQLIAAARDLGRAVGELSFGAPVCHVYNPLDYAWEPHRRYLERFGAGPRGRVVLVGMNPGPWGMAQTGVPFGEVATVREWMGIEGEVGRPAGEHPKRPVEGFDCPRSEVSGGRLWGWARARFGAADRFFDRFFVLNYCPLAFLEESGRNRTPDRLRAAERRPLFAACDEALARSLVALAPSLVVGVGRFATDRVSEVIGDGPTRVGRILHPSPASPKANRDWEGTVEGELRELGVVLDGAGG